MTSTHFESALAPDQRIDGDIVRPEDEGWDVARRAWNLALDQRPAAVAFPESAADVGEVVGYARAAGLRVAPQGTGHNASPLGDLSDTILLKTERMRGVTIDPEARTARVEAGVLWIEVVRAAAKHGLATLAGSSPDVGVVGYTVGGGVSWLGRKYGLSANNVEAVELVTADGRHVRADRDNEPDLFWAVRGGGGAFGIVTALELRLFPHEEVYAGILWFPIERAAEVLQTWREITQSDLPDSLTTVGRILQLPPLPMIPEPVRGKSFAIVEVIQVGSPFEAEAHIAPLRKLGPAMDTLAMVPLEALSHLHMDPEEPVPGAGTGTMLAELTPEAIDAFVDVVPGSPLLSAEIRHIGGELKRARPEHGALAAIDAEYAVFAVGMAPTPEAKVSTEIAAHTVKQVLEPWAARHMYLNFAEGSEDARTFWSEQAYHRLRRIKAKVDPTGLIRSNHEVA